MGLPMAGFENTLDSMGESLGRSDAIPVLLHPDERYNTTVAAIPHC